MSRSFVAEVLKLRKRPACWVLFGLLQAAIILLLYALPYVILTYAAHSFHGTQAQTLANGLRPESLVTTLLPFLNGLGRGFAIVLGALLVGSEYGWGTVKTILIQRPSRLSVFGGKALALASLLAVFVLASFVTAFAASVVVTVLRHDVVAAPSLLELGKGLAGTWLIFATSASLTACLAVLCRGTGIAIGLALVEGLFLENIISGLLGQLAGWSAIPKALPGLNANALTDSFTSNAVAQGSPLVSAGHAVLVLIAYTLCFILLASFLFRKRDVA